MNTRTIEVRNKSERSKFSLPAKAKPWRHEDELRNAIGKTLTIYSVSDWEATGVLINCDQYTVQLRVQSDVTSDQSVFTYYKSALLGYKIED